MADTEDPQEQQAAPDAGDRLVMDYPVPILKRPDVTKRLEGQRPVQPEASGDDKPAG